MRLSTMNAWLDWIGSVHQTEIALGLERVVIVAERLSLLNPNSIVIEVGGTNGKGSTVSALESIYLAAGYHVGTFMTPILFRHNEEVRVNGVEASDDDFCCAFEKIETARGDVTLTPFEYHTLAALIIFKKANLDIIILEVGMGGRLDAVNIIDADIAIVTSVSLDHTEFLGRTREAIGFEKAGIFRAKRFAICGDHNPPESLLEVAKTKDTTLFVQERDFEYHEYATHWDFAFGKHQLSALPKNGLFLDNMAVALVAIQLLQEKIPVSSENMKSGLEKAKLPGRMQIISNPITTIFDVAHNPASVLLLNNYLESHRITGKTYAVFSMLADKDIESSINAIVDEIDEWHIAPVKHPRSSKIDTLAATLRHLGVDSETHSSIVDAYHAVRALATEKDRIVVFGSFRVVAETMDPIVNDVVIF